MIEPEVCAPSKIKKEFTCYTKKDLRKLKYKYNKTFKQKINAMRPQDIWLELVRKLECKKESCIAQKLGEPLERFSPKQPAKWKQNKNEWLSSDEITKVLVQYEKTYPEFLYIGPSPSDFYFLQNGRCVWEELCRFDVHNVGNKTKVGIVFNLDEHSGGGTHWVAVFMDLIRKKMYYFDSTGEKIHKNIRKFFEKVKGQDSQYVLIQNSPVEHQFGNTECGMYVLFFIIIMLHTNDFSLFKRKQTFSDKGMERLRGVFFNT